MMVEEKSKHRKAQNELISKKPKFQKVFSIAACHICEEEKDALVKVELATGGYLLVCADCANFMSLTTQIIRKIKTSLANLEKEGLIDVDINNDNETIRLKIKE